MVASATAYALFVTQRKRGLWGVFERWRAFWQRRGGVVAGHLLCPTCAAISYGLAFWLLYDIARPLVALLAVAGLVMVLHGLAGHWHQGD